MILPQATPENISSLSPLERSAYLVNDLSHDVIRQDNGEPLATQIDIEHAGITCEPFWNQPADIEGESYKAYLKQHPDFSLSVRTTVLAMLIAAQRRLPSHWQLVLKSGYRPYEVQVALLQSLVDDTKTRHPDWSGKQTLAHARTFISDPSLVCPPHVTGGAIDLDIIDRHTGQPVDIGCPPNTDTDIAFLHSDKLTEQTYANRMQLLDVMLETGFAPLASEWWHYQYGDTYWAAFYGHRKTEYDLIK